MMRVALLFTGNSPAVALSLVYQELAKDSSISLSSYSSGAIYPDSMIGLSDMIFGSVKDLVETEVDVLVIAPRFPGLIEAEVVKHKSEEGCQVIAVCSDIGHGPAKYSAFQKLPDLFLLPEKFSLTAFQNAGISKDRLCAAGSPYLDHVLQAKRPSVSAARGSDVAYLSVPNRKDWTDRSIKGAYTEEEIHRVLSEVCQERVLKLTERRHPYEIHIGKSISRPRKSIVSRIPIEEFITKFRFAVSTYSTSLLVSRVLDVCSISYQPTGAPLIRSEVFEAAGVELCRDKAALSCALESHEIGFEKDPFEPFWFCPGTGVSECATKIKSAARVV